jgi:hypothetical protein
VLGNICIFYFENNAVFLRGNSSRYQKSRHLRDFDEVEKGSLYPRFYLVALHSAGNSTCNIIHHILLYQIAETTLFINENISVCVMHVSNLFESSWK